MSPAATRRYRVRLNDWESHEMIVLATSKEAAVAKAIAINDLTGLGQLPTSLSAVDWDASVLSLEVLQ
ncbi:hypothetical protein BDS110ZK14_77710 [Bradyrhizobium diazoefficiens]|nr:hypothetical protein XF15B_58900 [Bradyrhizobium diazoefficiens]